MKTIIIDKIKYDVIKDVDDAVDEEAIKERLTDYFYEFDYVVGDWAYSKLRLKGFYKKENKKVSKINNIENLGKYIDDYCAYGCKYFVLEKKES